MKNYVFNTQNYPFQEYVREALNVYDLEKISAQYDLFTEKTDQSTFYHRQFYDFLDTQRGKEFLSNYKDFIQNLIHPLVNKCDLLYQTRPTFRVHLIGNKSVGGVHRDADYNHNTHEINVFVPLTQANETSTIWVESKPDLGDFNPINSQYGQFTVFDGANLRHYNEVNVTNHCRVSFDFRVLPKYWYKPGGLSTGQKKSFTIGDYWSIL